MNPDRDDLREKCADDLAAGPILHNEGGAAAASATAPSTSMAMLFASHTLRDGEVVLLLLKPSLFYIALTSIKFVTFIVIVMLAGRIFDTQLPGPSRVYIEAGMFLIFGRITWSIMQWMSRLYMLTDQRIVRLSGVFNTQIYACPLRKVARTRIIYGSRIEKILNVGSIEIIPADDEHPIDQWQLVGRPVEVHEQIVATINRAKAGLSCK